MSRKIMELKERYAEIRESVENFAEELASGEELTDERKTEYRSLIDEGEALKERIGLHEQAIAMIAESGGELRSEPRVDRNPERPRPVDRRHAPTRDDYDRAVSAWFQKECRSDADSYACARLGIDPTAKSIEVRLHPESRYERVSSSKISERVGYETRDQSTSGDPNAIPSLFLNRLEVAMATFGNVRAVAEVFRTESGADMPMPTTDDTGNNAAILAEAAAHPAVTDVDFGSVTFKSWKFASRLKASREFLQDSSALQISTRLGDMLGQRVSRAQNLQFTEGDGTTEPQGIITGATAVNTGTIATLDADDIIDLFHAVDPAYRGSAIFMMHDLIVAHIKKIRDDAGGAGLGNFLWGDLRDGADLRLQGRPVIINNHMASTVATGNDVVLFGDAKKYMIRDVQSIQIQRADEIYIENDQVGFFVTARTDGRVIDAGTNPLKYLNVA